MRPLLRTPPFPNTDPAAVALTRPGGGAAPRDRARLEALVERVRAAGVAGDFWRGDPAADDRERRLIAAIAAGDADTPGLAEALLGPAYRDPYSGADITAEAAVALLAEWKAVIAANAGIRAAAGMAWWKRRRIAGFLWSGEPLRFVRSTAQARAAGGTVAVWPSRSPAGLADGGQPLVRVEDGFIRSIGLGADLLPPCSVAVDRQGIHYDPARPSDLETILLTHPFPPALLHRAEALRRRIVAGGVSKYGVDGTAPAPARRADGRRVVLVPGQVEDDMSVRLGGAGIATNLDLLARARAAEPGAHLLFKPHPDVDAGHRRGWTPDAALLAHADEIVRGESMPSLLARIDAVHVLTSLTGFEALLRGLEVVTHGQPFFAGWGLTRDLARPIDRRARQISLDQLVAGVLILYPRYMDPVTELPCSPERLLERFTSDTRSRTSWVVRIRRLQGRISRSRTWRAVRNGRVGA